MNIEAVKKPSILGEKNPNWKGGAYRLVCEECGEEFHVKYGRKDTARFCSFVCANNWQKKNPYNTGPRVIRIDRNCLTCGKPFEILPSRKAKVFFCSKDCQFIWRSKHHAGENNPNWLGGISREPYPFNWVKIKKVILERDHYSCQNPFCESASHILNVHHIDYNRLNSEEENLITLCAICHGRTNFNRDYWQGILKGVTRVKGKWKYERF